MSDVWTHERVLGLAPDAASAKAASGLAHASKWTSLGRSDVALWGEVQGSGKDPYRARVDLRDAATKCSCPSRKFPCKHGLALLLMHAAAPGTAAVGSPPDWVAEWLASRAEREEARAAREAKADATPADPAAQARRAAAREGKVAAGLDELRAFLDDVVRQGLASAHAAATSPWGGWRPGSDAQAASAPPWCGERRTSGDVRQACRGRAAPARRGPWAREGRISPTRDRMDDREGGRRRARRPRQWGVVGQSPRPTTGCRC
jgi:hypothetical protein